MKVFRFIIAFSILVNSSSTFAATEQCRLIDGKKDRQACYDRQATAAETVRKTSGESKAVGSVEEHLDPHLFIRNEDKKETLDQWATRILLHAHAIAPCPDHGYMRLRFCHQGLDYAHALAEQDRYPRQK